MDALQFFRLRYKTTVLVSNELPFVKLPVSLISGGVRMKKHLIQLPVNVNMLTGSSHF